MKKTVVIKAVSIAAASAVLLISTYGCSIAKKLYADMESATEGLVQDYGAVENYGYSGGMAAAITEEFPLVVNGGSADVAYGAESSATTVSEAWAADSGESSYEEKLEEYKPYGLEYIPATGLWWYGDKPLAAFYDPENYTMTNGLFVDVGAYVLADRDAQGKISGLREVGQAGFTEACGLQFSGTLQDTAKENGAKYYEEDITVKQMTSQELYATECNLHAKYRHEDAIVKLNDYVIYLNKDDMLSLSSFCSSSNNAYGVKLYADYDIADELDIASIDPADVDMMLLALLKTNEYDNARDLETAAKKAFAQQYGISEKNLLVFSSLI